MKTLRTNLVLRKYLAILAGLVFCGLFLVNTAHDHGVTSQEVDTHCVTCAQSFVDCSAASIEARNVSIQQGTQQGFARQLPLVTTPLTTHDSRGPPSTL